MASKSIKKGRGLTLRCNLSQKWVNNPVSLCPESYKFQLNPLPGYCNTGKRDALPGDTKGELSKVYGLCMEIMDMKETVTWIENLKQCVVTVSSEMKI